jgi:hypothetical protein
VALLITDNIIAYMQQTIANLNQEVINHRSGIKHKVGIDDVFCFIVIDIFLVSFFFLPPPFYYLMNECCVLFFFSPFSGTFGLARVRPKRTKSIHSDSN